jgi:hypothetical protein
MKRFLLLAILLGGAAFPAHASRESYQKKVERELGVWNERVEHLRKRSEDAGHETRAEIDRRIDELQARTAVARKRLEDLSNATGSRWSSFRHEVDKALKDVRRAYRSTKSYFRKNEKEEQR